MTRHACDLPDLDYSKVAEGKVVCTVCGRKWLRREGSWQMFPKTRRPR